MRPSSLRLRSPAVLVAALAFVSWTGPAWAWQVEHRLVIEHGGLSIDQTKGVTEITRAQAAGGFPAER